VIRAAEAIRAPEYRVYAIVQDGARFRVLAWRPGQAPGTHPTVIADVGSRESAHAALPCDVERWSHWTEPTSGAYEVYRKKGVA
jgi:hypothetical protein